MIIEFNGTAGTGKTFQANQLAHALGKNAELLTIKKSLKIINMKALIYSIKLILAIKLKSHRFVFLKKFYKAQIKISIAKSKSVFIVSDQNLFQDIGTALKYTDCFPDINTLTKIISLIYLPDVVITLEASNRTINNRRCKRGSKPTSDFSGFNARRVFMNRLADNLVSRGCIKWLKMNVDSEETNVSSAVKSLLRFKH